MKKMNSDKNRVDNSETKNDKDGFMQRCFGYSSEGLGLVRFKGADMGIKGLIPEENAKIKYFRKGEQYWGQLQEITNHSKYRAEPKCKHHDECGGCQLQHLSYEGQLKFKHDKVEKLLKEFGDVNQVIGMENPTNYRNKIHATYGRGNHREAISGFYSKHSHRLVPIESCMIQDPIADEINMTIRALLKSFKLDTYEESTQRGFLRHVLVKVAQKTGEVMVVIVGGTRVFPGKKNFVKALLKEHEEITTVIYNLNDKETSMVLGDKEEVLYGKGVITDLLCGYKFNISSKSFYQVNPVQTEKLYSKAIEMAKFSGRETVLDAYSGIGTIGMVLSKKVKHVLSVELNKDAFKDAIGNAKLNGIKNIKFYNEDAGEYMLDMASRSKKIHTVIMDPPRSGSDYNFLESIVKIQPKQVIYISCNPETQARDLKHLVEKGYKVDEIQPVDMFPFTHHVECVVKLSLI